MPLSSTPELGLNIIQQLPPAKEESIRQAILQFSAISMSSIPILTLDVAHPSRHPDIVEQELLDAWSKVRNSSSLRILKIVHGHGSSGKGGSTKNGVRGWAFRNRGKFRAIIEGESYSVYDSHTQEMRTEVGPYGDTDLESSNPGITLLWVK